MKLDPKTVFYLKHREQIDEWSGLRDQATTEAHGFLKSLSPSVTELARKWPNVRAYISLDDVEPRMILHRDTWLDSSSEWPRVAIGIWWSRNKVMFHEVWGGVWLDEELHSDRRLSSALTSSLDGSPEIQETFKRNKWWPAWRYETPSDPEFWNNLDAYGKQLVQAVEGHWLRFSPHVDKAIKNNNGR